MGNRPSTEQPRPASDEAVTPPGSARTPPGSARTPPIVTEDAKTPATPATPAKSPMKEDDGPTAAALSPTSPRSPTPSEDQPGLGSQFIMGINGLWSTGVDWWYTRPLPAVSPTPSSPNVVGRTLSAEQLKSQRLSVKSGKEQSAESEKDEDIQTCVVLIKPPEKGRYTVHKHDPAYQTLYGLVDPFGEDKKKDKDKQ